MKVLVTGTAEQGGRLAARLRREGLEPVECPLVAVRAIGESPIRVDGYDWLVLTSRSAVHALLARLDGPLPRVAAIGPGTAEALRDQGVEPTLVAEQSTQEGLLARFPAPPGRVLFVGAEGARQHLVRELGADFLPIYRTVELVPDELPEADVAVIASGSAARALARTGAALSCVSIGPTTSAHALAAGLTVVAEATTNDLDGLVEAVRLAQSRRSPNPGLGGS